MLHLLSSELPDIIKQEDAERMDAIVERGRIKNLKEGDPYTFDVAMDPKLLTSKTLKLLQKESNYRVQWCHKMVHFITRILREVRPRKQIPAFMMTRPTLSANPRPKNFFSQSS